jgi:V/A-type H+-transporting ATPase subunit I
MFKPARMKLVTLDMVRDDAPELALTLAEMGAFDPEVSEDTQRLLPEPVGERYAGTYGSAQGHVDKLLEFWRPEHIPTGPVEDRRVPTQGELAQLDAWLEEAWGECSRHEEARRKIAEDQQRLQQLWETLRRLAALEVDLGAVAQERRFLDVRIGLLPTGNVPALRDALALAAVVIQVFHEAHGEAHALVVAPRGREHDITAVLRSAGWRSVQIPVELRDDPPRARARLLELQRDVKDRSGRLDREIRETKQRWLQRVTRAALLLVNAQPYALLAAFLRARGALASVTGWIPASELDGMRRHLAQAFGCPIAISARDPRADERRNVPSLLRHRRWLQPFARLVEGYGVPRYGEFDPTLLFALSFVAMFGMMFGDVGQGAVIAAAGVLFRRRLDRFGPLVFASGISSVLFGVLYGSVFGLETILAPVWMTPLHDPTRMLLVALYVGIGFVVATTLISIYNRLSERAFGEALLDGSGLAGLLLYLAVVAVAWLYMRGSSVGFWGVGAVGLPLGAVAIYEWRRQPGTRAERILVALVEAIETVLKYGANTLSFLRVAAFSLNHVALALAVLSIARMMGPPGHWVTVVIGNVVVLVLEGAIVGIQALRLEYYEGFSRFFHGDGRPFRPLRLRASLQE